MDFSVLGPLQVTVTGSPIPVRGGLPRALTVLLLLRRRAPTSAEVIVDRLWSAPPADPANAVHRVVSHLRRALGPAGGPLLVTHAPGYALLADDDAVDATRFARLVHGAMGAAPPDRRRGKRCTTSMPRSRCGAVSRWPTWHTTNGPPPRSRS